MLSGSLPTGTVGDAQQEPRPSDRSPPGRGEDADRRRDAVRERGRRDDQRAADRRSDPRDRGHRADPAPEETVAALEARVRELEAEKREMRDRYERLLEKRTRALDDCRSDDADRSPPVRQRVAGAAVRVGRALKRALVPRVSRRA